MANEFVDPNIADMVEVKKTYTCRKCGIRYDTAENMEQHHRDAHIDTDTASNSGNIKEEMEDDQTEYVILSPEELQEYVKKIGENQQIMQQTIENGQVVYLVDKNSLTSTLEGHTENETATETEESVPAGEKESEVPASSTATTKSPPKRQTAAARKRKLTESAIAITPPTSRPKRHVVPNIKSEFVYDSITTATSAAIANATAAAQARANAEANEAHEEEEETTGNAAGPRYTLVQEGNVITAWQVPAGGDPEGTEEEGEAATSPSKAQNNDQNNNQEEGEELEEGEDPDSGEYPQEYTPTSKIKKGRINPPKEDDSALRRFPCPFQGCTYIAKYRSNLWDHKKTHTGEKPYICSWPSCTMRFSQTHQLKLHLRSHTGERPYICTWPGCNSAFSQKPGLKSHMLTHTGEKPFKCDFPGCGWSFRLKGALTDHKRAIHENAKKHVCEWPGCNKRFLQHCHLKKHIMGHADIKPFSCDWPNCNYKAVTMAYVTNHRKTHTGEKNYECTYPNCNKRFVKSSHVNRHRQRCHPDLFMMVSEDGNEEIIHGSDVEDEEDEEQQYAIHHHEVVQAPTTSRVHRAVTRSRSGSKQQQQQPQYVYEVSKSNQNGDDEEAGTTIYIQSEDVEEEMVQDGVHQFINGSVVTGESGEQYIISTGESGEMQATPIVIEFKKEHNEEEEEEEGETVEHELVQEEEEHQEGVEVAQEGQSFVINSVDF